MYLLLFSAIYSNAVYAYWMKISLFLTDKPSLLFIMNDRSSSANLYSLIIIHANDIWLEYWQLLFIYLFFLSFVSVCEVLGFKF